MRLHGVSPSPLNRINVINATANKSIWPIQWIPLEVRALTKAFILQKQIKVIVAI